MTVRPSPFRAMRIVLRDHLANGAPIGPTMRLGLWGYGLLDDQGCVTDLAAEFLEFGPVVLNADLPFGWPVEGLVSPGEDNS